MLKIAICDDDYNILIQLERYLFEISKQENLYLDVEVFSDGKLLRKELSNGTIYDIIYMDIQMKNENGITTVQEIRKTDEITLVIYISSYEKYAIELFPLGVFYFIRKPVSKEEFRRVFLAANRRLIERNVYFTYSYKSNEYKHLQKDIIYFESRGRKIHIHLNNGEIYFFYGKLSDVEQKTKDTRGQFIRIHQSYLVNYHHIVAKSRKWVTLSNGETVRISEERQKAFRIHYAQLAEAGLNV